MNYVEKVSQIVSNYREAISTAQKELADWKNDKPRKYKYSDVYRAQKAAELEAAIAEARNQGLKALNEALTIFVGEQQFADILDASKLTEDTKLLESDFNIPKETLQAIFDKNSGNRTMQQLTLFRAQKDGIFLERIFYTAQNIVEAARAYSYWTGRAIMDDDFYLRVWIDPELNEQMIPEALKGRQ